jgi:hypothetical protein
MARASRNTIVREPSKLVTVALAGKDGDGEWLQQIIAAYKRRSARSVRRWSCARLAWRSSLARRRDLSYLSAGYPCAWQ